MPLKRHLRLRRQSMLPLQARFHSAEAACLRSGINSPTSTRHSGRITFQCKFVEVLVFFKKNYNIIYEQLINISLIYFIFRFTNIKAARVNHRRLNRRWRFHYFNGVRYPNILNGYLKSMHGLTDLRLVLISNFHLISNKLLI